MKSIVKSIYFLFLGITFHHAALSQLSVAQFLNSAQSDKRVNVFDEQIDYLNQKPYRLSPIQKMEFRTESNQLDPNRQDYALRFNPANPWEIKNTNKYFTEYKSLLWLEKQIALKEALVLRYHHVIQYGYLQELSNIEKEKSRLLEKQLSIMEAQQFSDFFKAEDYLELKLDFIDQSTEVEEAHFDLNNQVLQMAGLYPSAIIDSIGWTLQDLISIDRIAEVVDSLSANLNPSANLSYREKQITLANTEYNLEKSNINMGFMQAQYQHFRIAQDRSPWSLSLGFTIPIANPNKGDMAKKKIEVIEAEYERDETELELVSEKNLAIYQIKNLIVQYQELKTKSESLSKGSFSATLGSLNDSNPLPIIRFNANLLKLKTLETKLKNNIYLAYIAYLASTDQLQQTPLVNFLSYQLSPIGF